MIKIGAQKICKDAEGKILMVCACTDIDEKRGVCEFYSNKNGEWEFVSLSTITEDEFMNLK